MARLWLVAAAVMGQQTDYEEKLARDPNKRDPETKVDIAIIMHGLSSPTKHTRYDGCTTTNADWRPTAHQIMTYLRPHIDADLFLHTWAGNESAEVVTAYEPTNYTVEDMRDFADEYHQISRSLVYDMDCRYDRRVSTGQRCPQVLQNKYAHFYSMREAIRLSNWYEWEHRDGTQYMLFIVCRLDLVFTFDDGKMGPLMIHRGNLRRVRHSRIAVFGATHPDNSTRNVMDDSLFMGDALVRQAALTMDYLVPQGEIRAKDGFEFTNRACLERQIAGFEDWYPLKRRVKAVEASSLEPLCHVLRRESDKACPRLTVNRRLDPAYDACRRATLQRPVAPLTDVDLSITIDDDHHTLKVYAESSAHEVRRVVDTFLHKRWWFDGKLPLQPRFTNDSKLLDDAAGRLVDALFEQQALHGNASNQHLPHEEWLRAPYDYPYESAPTEIDEDLANRSPDDFERISEEEAESYLYPVGEEPGRKLADWIMHWYDPDEKHVYNDMGKRPGTRYETVMPWEHPSRTGVPFPPPDWSPCGTSLEPVDAEDCPRDSDLAACDKVACGVLCEGDGECGTDGGLDNCGGFDVYRKICGEKDEPARAPERPDLEPRAFLYQKPPEEEVVYID